MDGLCILEGGGAGGELESRIPPSVNPELMMTSGEYVAPEDVADEVSYLMGQVSIEEDPPFPPQFMPYVL